MEILTNPPGLLSINKEGTILNLNPAAAASLGADIKLSAGRSFQEFLLSEEVPRFNRLMEKCRETLKPVSDEFKIVSGSRGVLLVYLTSIPLDGAQEFFKIIFDFVREPNQDDKILYESEKRFRLMADDSPVMIWMTNADNDLEYMNKTKLEFLGKELAELSNKGWMETRHPEDREKFLNAINEASRERKKFSIEIRVRDKNGKYRWLLDSASPRFTEDNKFAGFIGSGVDITEEKNFRTSLEKSLKEKEVLLTEIHHRVKNNLQVISSLLSLQASQVDDEYIIEMFNTCRDRIRSMAVLHEKLYQSKNIHKVNVREYLNDLLSYLHSCYNKLAHIKLLVEVADLEMSIGLCLNTGLILNELVSNALKHAFKEKESGEINVTLVKKTNDCIRLIVKDNGAGIPEDYNFEKSKSVGLMLVRNLADQHNGTLEIIRNGGTEFRIELFFRDDQLASLSDTQVPEYDLMI